MSGLNGYLLFWTLLAAAVGGLLSWLIGPSWWVSGLLFVAVSLGVFSFWPVDTGR